MKKRIFRILFVLFIADMLILFSSILLWVLFQGEICKDIVFTSFYLFIGFLFVMFFFFPNDEYKDSEIKNEDIIKDCYNDDKGEDLI